MEAFPELFPILTPEYPSLSERIQSTFIDTCVIILLMFASASILDRFENVPDWVRILLFVSLWLIYEPFCTALGATVGNLIKGIRVRRHEDSGKSINIVQAILRYIIKISLGWISFLTIHSNPQRRAMHDIAAGSIMIRKK